MKKILFVSTRYPIPILGGDKSRAIGIIKFLSKNNKVDFLSLISTKQKKTSNLNFCNNVKIFKTNNIIIRLMYSFISVLKGEPLQIGFYYSHEIKNYINKVENNYDTIIFHQLRASQYLSNNFRGKKILEITDLQSSNYQQITKTVSLLNPVKYIYELEKFLIKRYERKVAKLFDKIVFISKRDVKEANRIMKYKKKILYINNACDLNRNLFKFNKRNFKVIFLGNIKYLPNKYACYKFVNEILPKLILEYPKIEFHVIGEINYFDKYKLGKYKNVILHESKEKLAYTFKNAICAICNLNIATGFQLKTLTYMSYGIPTISSLISIKGSDFKKNKEILVYKSNENLIKCILKLKNNKKISNNLSFYSRKAIKNRYKWNKTFIKYSTIV